ncbi:MAG TPA: hypothetical protein VNR87_09840 [Flavisolibacter sp.]|nr:hypothetical protein [Flavisolibacter sp.]
MAHNRRRFIQQSGSLVSGLWLSSLERMIPARPEFITNSKFKSMFLATNWGFNGSIAEYCSSVQKEGYDGIEIWWPMEKKAQDELFSALKKYNLQVGFLCGAYHKDVSEHFASFKDMVYAAASNTVQTPLYINCHSGRDFFPADKNQLFFDYTAHLSKQTGILICHETHRSRILFAPVIARNYLEKNPDLKITFDVSHWCTVSESLLADQQETVDLALERTEHIHARIGHAEGPQVNDPRAPEWAAAVTAHFSWWDKVVERKRREGGRITFLSEFGPPDYMPTLPYTRQPLADQWAINVYMMQILRKRYSTI